MQLILFLCITRFKTLLCIKMKPEKLFLENYYFLYVYLEILYSSRKYENTCMKQYQRINKNEKYKLK